MAGLFALDGIGQDVVSVGGAGGRGVDEDVVEQAALGIEEGRVESGVCGVRNLRWDVARCETLEEVGGV